MKSADYIKAAGKLAKTVLGDEHVQWVPAPKKKGQTKSPGKIPYVNKIAFFNILDSCFGVLNWSHGVVEDYVYPEGIPAVMTYIQISEETDSGIIIHRWTGVAEINAFNKQAAVRSADTTSISHIARAMWPDCRRLWWDADDDEERYPVKGSKPTLADYFNHPDDWNDEAEEEMPERQVRKSSKTKPRRQKTEQPEETDKDYGVNYGEDIDIIMGTIYNGNSVKQQYLVDLQDEFESDEGVWFELASDVADRIWTDATGGDTSDSGMMSEDEFAELVRWKVATADQLTNVMQFDRIASAEELVALYEEIHKLKAAVSLINKPTQNPYEVEVTSLHFSQDKNGLMFCVAVSDKYPMDHAPYTLQVLDPHLLLGVTPTDISKLEKSGMKLQKPYIGDYKTELTVQFEYAGGLTLQNMMPVVVS